MFSTILESMQSHGLIDALHDSYGVQTPSVQFRRSQIVKCIHAWGRLEIIKARKIYFRASSLREEAMNAKESIIRTFTLLMKYLNISSLQIPLLESDGSVSDNFAQVSVPLHLFCRQFYPEQSQLILHQSIVVVPQLLFILNQGYDLLSKDDGTPLSKSRLEGLCSDCDDIVACLCRVHPSDNIISSAGNSTMFNSTKWNAVPLPSSWQAPKHKAISLRCYNLCVSFNVSHFSGWEAHEFSLRVMKSRANCTYFGLIIQEGRVAGFLPPVIEEALAEQWEILGELLPAARKFEFRRRLGLVKELAWYKEGIEKYEDAIAEEAISANSEQEGLQILLAHSQACLRLGQEKEALERFQLLGTSLSILLPIVSTHEIEARLSDGGAASYTFAFILTQTFVFATQTQFCLDQNVWDSQLGKAAAGDSAMGGWRQVTRKVSVSKRSASRPNRKRSKPKEPPRPLDEWFPGEDRANPISNAVAIPVHEMNRLWLGATPNSTNTRTPTPAASGAMKNVHEAMQKLRVCYTDAAVEKASLEVATALLGLVSVQHACENPFLCIQQAAVFASHGTKRGNSDDLFRGRLPAMSECGADEALVILGRADCFQSVHFPYEAAYLCSYVARLCSLHRESSSSAEDNEDDEDDDKGQPAVSKSETGLGWSDKWMIVSILCYNVSIMIRTTLKKALADNQQSRKEEFDPWDEDVIGEFLMGRADALAWKQAVRKGEVFSCGVRNDRLPEDAGDRTIMTVESSEVAETFAV